MLDNNSIFISRYDGGDQQINVSKHVVFCMKADLSTCHYILYEFYFIT